MATQLTGTQRAYREWRQAVKTTHQKQLRLHLPWRESFDNFLQDMGQPPEGAKLRRTDSAGPFAPDNCYWG